MNSTEKGVVPTVHLGGTLKLTHDGQEDTFEEGDAVYLQANVAHSYE